MGCCGSKRVADGSKPNERSLLLSGDGTSVYIDSLHHRMTYQRYDATVDHAREQESLQKIVQRTAESLIDISNTHATERLQQQDAIDRANEYKELMSTIKLDSKAYQKLQAKSNTLPNLSKKSSIKSLASSSTAATLTDSTSRPPHIILSENSVTKEDADLLSRTIEQIHEVVEHIEVESVGDLVVSLPWANPSPVHPIH